MPAKHMATREIELDEDASQILESMANSYGGNASLAIAELLRAHETIELFLDELEVNHSNELAAQKARAERGFRDGRFTSWQRSNVKTACDRSLRRRTLRYF